MSDRSKTPDAMRRLLVSILTDSACDDWQLIGRSAYRRGTYGTMRLDLVDRGTHGTYNAVECTFTPHSGGAGDTLTLWFSDLLRVEKPKHQNWRVGQTPYIIEHCGWDWYMDPPDSLEPLHAAIADWLVMHDMTATDIAREVKDDERASKRRPSKRST